MTDTIEQPVDQGEEPGTDLVAYGSTPRTVDLRERSTDSWTDVVRDVARLADHVANTEFVPRELRGNAPAIAAAVLYGRELGLPPMTSLQGVAMVKGRPSLYAETMRALILQAGHELNIDEATASRCVISGKRKGAERWTSASWTLEDARRAGLLGAQGNYGKYPRQMLLARATTELARMIFADVIHGMRSAEEMIDEFDTIQGPTPEPAEPVKTTTVQRKPRKTKAEPKPADPEASSEAGDTAPPPPERKRAELPRPKTAPVATSDQGGDDDTAGAPTPEHPNPAAPSVEQQQAEIRRLSGERRDLQAAEQPARSSGEREQVAKTGPVTTDTSDGGEAVDAEVVTDPAANPKISDRQRGAIMGHWGRLGMMQDRDERLLLTCTLLGLEPGALRSTSDLTTGQAAKLLGIIERFKDRDAIDAHLNGQTELL